MCQRIKTQISGCQKTQTKTFHKIGLKSDIGELSFSSCMPEGQCVCEQCQARFLITDRNIQYLHRALGNEVHLQLLLEGRIRLSSI